MNIDADDRKWTAYVLGELDETERTALELELECSEEAREFVDELRMAALLMKEGLASEAAFELTAGQREFVRASAGSVRKSWFDRHARPVVWTAGLAAASVLIALTFIPALLNRTAPQQTAKSDGVGVNGVSNSIGSDKSVQVAPVEASTPAPALQRGAPSASAAASAVIAENETITGVVSDATKAVIPGVTVQATNVATGATASTLTDDKGAYRFSNLPSGTYNVTAGLPGFQTARLNEVAAPKNEEARADFALKVAAVNQSVEVSVSADSLLKESSASVGQVVTESRIKELPLVSNNVLDLIGTTPGAPTSFRDGQATTPPPTINPNVIGEVRVVTTPVDAELGRNAQTQGQQGQQGQRVQQAAGGAGGGRGGAGGRAGAGAGLGFGVGPAAISAGASAVVPLAPAAASPPPPPPPPPPAIARPVSAPVGVVTGLADQPIAPLPNNYERITDNPFVAVSQQPLATFSVDVDTASYANVRRFLNQNQLPPRDAVRIEELVNYFSYDYPQASGGHPITGSMDIAAAPWNPQHRLVRVGIKAKDVRMSQKASNLVFLIDVSGSMNPPERLPLLKSSLRLLVDRLSENDRISIVTYAAGSGIALQPTGGDRKDAILQAIENLHAEGGTNGGAGIQTAYEMAVANFIRGGVNRVILATDGDFNVGITDTNQLTRLIEDRAKSGVYLTVLGFGNNFRDSLLGRLADKGHGNYSYIDTLNEARKVLVEQMDSTLVTVAKDVKIQLEFNPTQVNAYRLLGYENRLMRAEDFNNDQKDAGDVGSGHTVTALFEVVPRGVDVDVAGGGTEPLRYQQPAVAAARSATTSREMLNLRIRYKEPEASESKLLEVPLIDRGAAFTNASGDFRFAAAVAGFGMILRDSPYKGSAALDWVLATATNSRGADKNGYRAEFIRLVQRAIQVRR